MASEVPSNRLWLQHPADGTRDHVRGNPLSRGAVTMVLYGDYLCPYCRQLRPVIASLRESLGERLVYIFRHFPNEKAHPGATFIAKATEGAARQGYFWEMHDWLYDNPAPTEEQILEHGRSLGLDMDRLQRDLESEAVNRHVDEDKRWAKRDGVTGTPTLFIDGLRYDGAWDFYSMLEAVKQPVAARVERSARAFASLPASGGLALLLAAIAALVAANTPLAALYHAFVGSPFGIGPPRAMLVLTVGEWCSDGLLAVFFLLVGLEIRRELTSGSLADPRAAMLPVVASIGGALVPAAIYLLLNPGSTASGWSVATATDIAFALGILALFGSRIPAGLRVFVAAFAVVDDILSVLTLAVFYPHGFNMGWLAAGLGAVGFLYVLNHWRVYTPWPYVLTAGLLWVSLHSGGIHGALAGVVLAGFLPARPTPSVSPLLAQAATALATLETEQKEANKTGETEQQRLEEEAVWDWASRNLAAASDRLLSPADRIERAVSPWSAYLVLPLFAFSATGVDLGVPMSAPGALNVLMGVVLGLALGKPAGICLASLAAIKTRIAVAPEGLGARNFLGAACLCGVGGTVSLLMADVAFPPGTMSAIAKIGVLAGSLLGAVLGAAILGYRLAPAAVTEAAAAS